MQGRQRVERNTWLEQIDTLHMMHWLQPLTMLQLMNGSDSALEDDTNDYHAGRTSYWPPLTPEPMVELTRPHPAHIQIDVLVADEDRFRWLDLDDPERRRHRRPDIPPVLSRSLTLPSGWHRFGSVASCLMVFSSS